MIIIQHAISQEGDRVTIDIAGHGTEPITEAERRCGDWIFVAAVKAKAEWKKLNPGIAAKSEGVPKMYWRKL